MKRTERKPHLKFNIFFISCALLILIGSNINAQVINKTIEKTVEIDKNTAINISHNGAIDYKTWDKNQLKVVLNVNIVAQTSDEVNSFYAELKEQIDKSLSQMDQGIIAGFAMDFKKVKINNGVMKMKLRKNNRTYSINKYKIYITVYAPKTNNLKLNIGSIHSYHTRWIVFDGILSSYNTNADNLRIDNLEGDADLSVGSTIKSVHVGNCKNLKLKCHYCKDVEIGNVVNADISLSSSNIKRIGKIQKRLNLNSKFSDFNGSSSNIAKVFLKSSSFEMDSVQDMELESNFSKNIRIKEVSNLDIIKLNSSNLKVKKIVNLSSDFLNFSSIDVDEVSDCSIKNSKSSKFYINNVKNINIDNAEFGYFRINKLTRSFICNSKSGDIIIESVIPGFHKIKINGNYVNINIDLDDCSYKLAANLQYPNLIVDNKRFVDNPQELNTSFVRGANKNTKSEVSFDCNSCKIRLE